MAPVSVGQRIKQLREARGFTQVYVAAHCGVSQKAISLLENDETRTPLSRTLRKLAHLFEVDPDWLLTGKGPRNPISSLTDEESELLLVFRTLSSAGQTYLLARAHEMHRDEYRTSSAATPPEDSDLGPRTPHSRKAN